MKRNFMGRHDTPSARMETDLTVLRRRLAALVRFYRAWASVKEEKGDWSKLPARLQQSAADARKIIEELDAERERGTRSI